MANTKEEDIQLISSMDLLFAKFSDLFDDFAAGKGKATEVRNAIRNIKSGIRAIEKNLGLTPENRKGKEKEFSEDYQFIEKAISRFIKKSPKDITPLVKIEKDVRDTLKEQGLTWEEEGRKKETVIFKIIIAYFAKLKGYTLHEIGNFLGKDHSTIQHYHNRCDSMLKNTARDPELYRLLTLCKDKTI